METLSFVLRTNYYNFEKSAHSPLWEEPERFMENVREVLEKTK